MGDSEISPKFSPDREAHCFCEERVNVSVTRSWYNPYWGNQGDDSHLRFIRSLYETKAKIDYKNRLKSGHVLDSSGNKLNVGESACHFYDGQQVSSKTSVLSDGMPVTTSVYLDCRPEYFK